MNEQEQFLTQVQQLNGADLLGEQFYHDAQRPYRLAVDLNALLVHHCSESAYTVTPMEREAMLEDLVIEQQNEGTLSPDDAQTARQYWFRIYGRRHDG